MINRLHSSRRARLAVLFPFFILLATASFAQTSAFNFSYPGPDTVVLGANCGGTLFGRLGTPVVSSTVGATITQSYFDSIASGFSILNTFFNIQTVAVHWHVADNQGNMADFTILIYF